MRRFLQITMAAGILATISGCANNLVDADLSHVVMVSGSQCGIAKIATLPATLTNNQVFVPATINGSEYSFLFDTGAGSTSVTPELVAAERLEYTGARTKVVGVGGAALTKNVLVSDFDLGGFHFRDSNMTTAAQPRAAGIIGEQFLQAFDVEIDLPHRQIVLYGSKHCDEGFLPWAKPYVRFPATVTAEAVYIGTWLDGKAFLTLIDTGAALTVVTTRGMKALDLTSEALEKDPKIQISGAGGGSMDVHAHRFSRLGIGADVIEHPIIAVGKINAPAQLLLGLDFLSRHRVWISYATNQVFIAPPSPS